MKQLLKKLLNAKRRRKILDFLNKFWCTFCRCLPVRNVVLFYTIRANGKLADNSKAVYDALDAKKVIFAEMLPHSSKAKLRVYFYLLTSKVIVTDDYVRYMRTIKLRKNQKLIQIWHACGAFKKFGLDAPGPITKKEEIATHSQYNAVVVTAEHCKQFYASAFGIKEEICMALGLPRTDSVIKDAESLRNKVYSRHPEFRDKKIYLYCPTFREKNGKRIKFDSMIDWEKLNSELGDDEIFIIRRHPVMKYNLADKKYPKIIDLTDESTLELTTVSSAIITDYSSVIYDACLLDVPSVFYCPDYKDYERGFYLKFPDDLPGEMITEPEKLLSTIRNTVSSPDKEKTEKFKSQQLSACDGNSSKKVAELIKSWL